MNRSPREVLLAAAAHIEAVGWIQGKSYADYDDIPNSPCCVIGAIEIVVGDNNLSYAQARSLLLADLRRDGRELSVTVWNDTPGMTADDVIDGLRAAAMNA